MQIWQSWGVSEDDGGGIAEAEVEVVPEALGEIVFVVVFVVAVVEMMAVSADGGALRCRTMDR